MSKEEIKKYWSDHKNIKLQKELSSLSSFELWQRVKLCKITMRDMAEYHRLKIARKNNIKNLCDVTINNWQNIDEKSKDKK